LIDPLVSLTCYYIKHAHFGLLYAFSNTHGGSSLLGDYN
jgi:hypothetical protein